MSQGFGRHKGWAIVFVREGRQTEIHPFHAGVWRFRSESNGDRSSARETDVRRKIHGNQVFATGEKRIFICRRRQNSGLLQNETGQ